ncbi:hypothetical protein RFI_25372 [Reticulomyxa filosa]|uniref:EF-hand domain-containing protein n=1 Tax=Reticulomyxa filosa TaxID=46433 RepID=X6MDP8_RETFI|nr:hypothetical protein RFI_25372 [Reticulomyxa filosa]|eukprot:ETO12004.1 hypothetical protein RFI_25372 [Reticulomyxa filosa]
MICHITKKKKKVNPEDLINEEERRDTVNDKDTDKQNEMVGEQMDKSNGISTDVEINKRRPTRNGEDDEKDVGGGETATTTTMTKSEFGTMEELIAIRKKINIILKAAFKQADVNNSNDLDIEEFGTLLSNLGIRVSGKGAMLLFAEILDRHNKTYLGFYEFKQAFAVNDPSFYIQSPADVNASIILRKHVKDYYEVFSHHFISFF